MDEFLVESDESWEASEALLGKLAPGEVAVTSADTWFVANIGDPGPVTMFAPTPVERSEAQKIQEEIEFITDQITEREAWLQIGWVKLGMLVFRVREKQYWLDFGYKNFPEFVQNIATRVDRKRSYIYQCKGIAEKLLPQLTADTLVEIGITKAGELKKLTLTGKLIPQDVVDKAKTGSTHEVKAVVQTILNPKTPVEEGKWFDLGGFYMTPEERTEFKTAYKLALQDPDFPIPTDLPEHVEKKIVFTRWYQEYLSTHGGQA